MTSNGQPKQQSLLHRLKEMTESSDFRELTLALASAPPRQRADLVRAAITMRPSTSFGRAYTEGVVRCRLCSCLDQLGITYSVRTLAEQHDVLRPTLDRLAAVDAVSHIKCLTLEIIVILALSLCESGHSLVRLRESSNPQQQDSSES